MSAVNGLHHVTAIAGPARENLEFYAGVLGMRLVKRSVNQDDPGTYHLFYADAEGTPGSDLTFFPWSQMAPRREGHGLSTEVSLTVPAGSLPYWEDRLRRAGTATFPVERRWGKAVLPLQDPHGLRVALVENAVPRRFAAWGGSPVPEAHQIRGLESARLVERGLAPTAAFLTQVLGFQDEGQSGEWHRYGFGEADGSDAGRYVEVRESADMRRGAWGTGSIHHLAWRVDDSAHQQTMRSAIEAAGRRPTEVIDRFWFKSVYFLEPGGVLFELATDGPGFAVDEDPAHLGEHLVLPPWLEAHRADIEARLPALPSPAVGVNRTEAG